VHGQARLALVAVAAMLVALAVWTWLPPTESSQEAMKQSILRYDTASLLAWPENRSGQTTLPKSVKDELRATWRSTLAAVSEGDALARTLQFDAVDQMLGERRRQPDRVVVATGGEVVYFDVRRRTLKGAVIVRAAVAEWVEAGTWDADGGTVAHVTRQQQTNVPVSDYTLRQRGDVWKIVDRAAPKDGPFFYDTETGEFGTGT